MIMLTATGKYFWKYQSGNMLSLPLVLTFFLLIGIKDANSLPVNWSANWVFVTSEGPGKWPYFSAFRKVVFLFYLLPLYLSLFVFYSFLWGWRKSGLHCLYDLVFAVFLMEILFFQQRKFPFACSYLPGKSQLHEKWLIYVFAFVFYIMVPRWLEPDVLANASRFITFYGVSFLIFVGLWLYHKIYFYPKQSLIYEDNPEPLVTELFHAI